MGQAGDAGDLQFGPKGEQVLDQIDISLRRFLAKSKVPPCGVAECIVALALHDAAQHVGHCTRAAEMILLVIERGRGADDLPIPPGPGSGVNCIVAIRIALAPSAPSAQSFSESSQK